MVPDNSDLVSCVMVTQASRLPHALRALSFFEKQTYAKRELIVVYDEPDFAAKTLFKAKLGGARVFAVQAPSGMSLGDLRNYGIARAGGEYIAQWDDDDWHRPDRLQVQIDALQRAGQDSIDACCLSRWTLAWPERDLYCISYERIWEGSIVGKKSRMAIYPAMDRGEDTKQIEGLRIVTLDRPDLYTYQVHGKNAWGSDHFESMFSASDLKGHELPAERIAEIKRALGVVG